MWWRIDFKKAYSDQCPLFLCVSQKKYLHKYIFYFLFYEIFLRDDDHLEETEDIDEGEGACRFGKNLEKVKSSIDRGKRQPYKGYAFGGLFEDKCDNYWCKTKEHAQRVEFAEKNVILYPNNEEPGKFCYKNQHKLE